MKKKPICIFKMYAKEPVIDGIAQLVKNTHLEVQRNYGFFCGKHQYTQ